MTHELKSADNKKNYLGAMYEVSDKNNQYVKQVCHLFNEDDRRNNIKCWE